MRRIMAPMATAAFLGVLQLTLVSPTAAVAADTTILPAPTITIYPGDSIRETWLSDHEFPKGVLAQRGAMIENREMLVGKVARRTLLAGAPIPINAVAEPKIVVNGAKVPIVFEEGGLSILTYGSALQAGAVGDIISVRNLDSGYTVSGTVRSDGSVRVSGG